jgi:hypothetical protein
MLRTGLEMSSLKGFDVIPGWEVRSSMDRLVVRDLFCIVDQQNSINRFRLSGMS